MIIVEIAGRLGRDAETRFTPSGQKVTTLTVATNVRKGGKDETVWWRVTIWGDRFDKILPYLKKGTAIIVVGDMNKPEIWTDKEGRPQISLEITAEMIRFSPFGNPDRAGQETQQQQGNYPNNTTQGTASFVREEQGEFGGNSAYGNTGNHFQGAAQGASNKNYGSTAAHQEEEDLPF